MTRTSGPGWPGSPPATRGPGGTWKARVALVVVLLLVLVTGAVLLGYSLGNRATPIEAGPPPPQPGFALLTTQADGYDSPQVEQSLDEVHDVGATWIQFTPTWYQDTRNTSEIAPASRTVSDAGLKRAIALAHERGLKVFLKPHIDLPNPGQDSRNNIRPDDHDGWFAAYTAFIAHYADIAEQTGVEQLAVGTELSSTTSDRSAWLGVIKEVRSRYRGALTYAANVDEYARIKFWEALDLIGIDAYWPLSQDATTDAPVLQGSWEPIRAELAAFSARVGKKILFTEAGYTSQEATTTDPSNWLLGTAPSQAEQAAAYQALLATFSSQSWWAGVYWWVWNDLPDTGTARDHATDFTSRGKAAEWVIRAWWAKPDP